LALAHAHAHEPQREQGRMSALTYEYRAIDRTGAKVTGTTQAKTESEAFRALTAQGMVPLNIQAVRQRSSQRGSKIKAKDLAHFTSQLSVLVSARVPISDGLMSIAEQEPNPRLKAVIKDIATRIEAGEPVAQSMGQHAEVFGDIYVETVRAAEKTGTLSRVLDHLAEMMERTAETQRMVRGALMYPICVLIVLAIAVTFLLGFVVPKFAKMFASRGVKLPALTEWMMHFGDSIQSYWFFYGAIIFGVIFAYKRAMKTEGGRALFDQLWHKVPFVRTMLQGMAISRFCHVLGVSLGAGLNLIEALELGGKSSGRPMLQRDVDRMTDRVRAGGRLTEVMGECPYMTGFAKRMIAAGETSGELTKMCSVAARHYDREAQHLAKNIGTLIEPIMIVVIAAVVLLVALSIFLPMWDMVSLVG
jgi:type II secretory pathway component PulF